MSTVTFPSRNAFEPFVTNRVGSGGVVDIASVVSGPVISGVVDVGAAGSAPVRVVDAGEFGCGVVRIGSVGASAGTIVVADGPADSLKTS